MNSARKILFFTIALLLCSSFTIAESSITPKGYAVYTTELPDSVYPDYKSFVYVYKAEVQLKNEATELGLLLEDTKKSELSELLFASVGNKDSTTNDFVDKEVGRVTTTGLKVDEVEEGSFFLGGGNTIEVDLKYGDQWADCSYFPGGTAFEVTNTSFYYCSDYAPGNRIIGVAKSQSKGLTDDSRFNIFVIDAPAELKKIIGNLSYKEGTNVDAFDRISTSLGSINFIRVDPSMVLPEKEDTSDSLSTAQNIKNTAVSVFQSTKKIVSIPIDSIIGATDDLYFLRPGRVMWNNPEKKDSIELVWGEVTKPGITGYVVEKSYISPADGLPKFEYTAVRVPSQNFLIFKQGSAQSGFDQDVEYTFRVFSYKDESIPNDLSAAVDDELMLEAIGGALRIEVTSSKHDLMLKNLSIRLVVTGKDGKKAKFKPDPDTGVIYTHEKNFDLSNERTVDLPFYFGVDATKCSPGSSFSIDETIIKTEAFGSDNKVKYYFCQDKGEYIDIAGGELRVVSYEPDGRIMEGDPSPEFASVEIIYLPDLKHTTKVNAGLFEVKVSNIIPTKPLVFSFSKTCDELEKELDEKNELRIKKERAEAIKSRKSRAKSFFENAKETGASMLSWIKNEQEYFSEETKYRSTLEVLGAKTGRTVGSAYSGAQSFWSGVKEGYTSFVDELKKAKDEATAQFRVRGTELPDNALFLPLSVNPATVYALPASAFSGENENRNTWYIKSVLVNGEPKPITEFKEKELPKLHVCQFDAGSVNLIAAYSALLSAVGDEPGSVDSKAPKVKSLQISKDSKAFEEYLGKDPRVLNKLDYSPADKIKVSFEAGEKSAPIYQWTLELWKKEPSKGDPCKDSSSDCVRVQVQSGGYLYEEDGKPVPYNKEKHGELEFSKVVAHNTAESSVIQVGAFDFKENTPAWWNNKPSTLKEALADAKKVWLRVEVCSEKDVQNCKTNGWLDSTSYLLHIGETEVEPEKPIIGCATIGECKAILDLKFIKEVFK